MSGVILALTLQERNLMDQTELKPGDVVTIRILESTSADAPVSATPARTEEDYKLQFEWAKKVYLENRDKFEGSGSNDEG